MTDDNNNNPSSDDHDDNPEQIRITLTLSPTINDPTLTLPLTDSIAVPSTIRRKGLSAVVNHLLDRHVVSDDDDDDDDDDSDNDEDAFSTDKRQQQQQLPALSFDFVIRDKLLRTDLGNFSRREGLSTEEALSVYYFPARRVPEGGGQSDVYPDWISSLSFSSRRGLLCAGGYDGMIRLFDHAAKDDDDDDDDDDVCRETTAIHSGQGPIKSLSSLSYSKTTLVATGSMDQTLVSHVYDEETNALRLHAAYGNGHYDSIDSVSLFGKEDDDAGGDDMMMMASGDWSGGLCLWKIPSLNNDDADADADDVPDKKRRTTTTSTSSSTLTPHPTIQPTSSIKAHTQSISSLAWNNDGSKLFTGSFDYGLKVWDVSRSDCLLTLNGSRVISCMGRPPRISSSVGTAEDVVATGHPDGTVRLWDMRVSRKKDDAGMKKVSENSFVPSHKAWVSGVEWSRLDPYVLATTSYDGCLKLWDVRSSLPLSTVRCVSEKGDKGLCLAMGKGQPNKKKKTLAMTGDVVFTGGSDGIVKRFVC